jgi:hypothetical protein
MMRNGRGRIVQFQCTTMRGMAEDGRLTITSNAYTPERMDMKHLKRHLCDGYKCEKCDVMCAYGRRYLALKEAAEA